MSNSSPEIQEFTVEMSYYGQQVGFPVQRQSYSSQGTGQQMGYGSQMQLGGYGQSYGGQGQSEWAMVRYLLLN
jgi:hypothetical protein